MNEEVKIGKKYKHFKGENYKVITIARDCENPDRQYVIYRGLYNSPDFGEGQVWIREINDFCGSKEINGKQIKRFKLIEDED